VDLTGVTYMDSSGLATLIETMRTGRRQGTRLVLSGIQEQPRYLLRVTDLDHVFEIEAMGTA
jgi:anti-sigma B factor antagonist